MLEENGQDLALENKYNNSPYRIPLRNKEGKVIDYALVDEDDYEKVNQYRWHMSNSYAKGYVNGKNMMLHYFIFQKVEEKNVIDHINRDRLDNRKDNLREATNSQNSQNITKKNNTSSVYIGVRYRKERNIFSSSCKNVHLGNFEKEIDAAIAYDKYSYKIFGNYALNNRLIKYEDTVNLNINDLIRTKKIRDLPLNIKIYKNKFLARRIYRKKIYDGKLRENIEEAEEDLLHINNKIEEIEKEEENLYLQQPIIRNKNGIAIIKIKDIEVLVDDENWYEFNKINWSYSRGYIQNSKFGLMHRFIMKPKDDEIVDHINKIKYDNRKTNLRIVTSSINNHNKNKFKNCSSEYIGVHFRKDRNTWRVCLMKDGKKYYNGSYKTELEAAKAYNEKAKELYGACANLNII